MIDPAESSPTTPSVPCYKNLFLTWEYLKSLAKRTHLCDGPSHTTNFQIGSAECHQVSLIKFSYSYYKLSAREVNSGDFQVRYLHDKTCVRFDLKYPNCYYSLQLEFVEGSCPIFSEARTSQDVFKVREDDVILQKGKKITSEFRVNGQSLEEFLNGYSEFSTVHSFLKIYRSAEKNKVRVLWEPLFQNPHQKLSVREMEQLKVKNS